MKKYKYFILREADKKNQEFPTYFRNAHQRNVQGLLVL